VGLITRNARRAAHARDLRTTFRAAVPDAEDFEFEADADPELEAAAKVKVEANATFAFIFELTPSSHTQPANSHTLHHTASHYTTSYLIFNILQ
jgi:hypothetical protein